MFNIMIIQYNQVVINNFVTKCLLYKINIYIYIYIYIKL